MTALRTVAPPELTTAAVSCDTARRRREVPPSQRTWRRERERVAELFDVSSAGVARALFVNRWAPDLTPLVVSGEMKLMAAHHEAAQRRRVALFTAAIAEAIEANVAPRQPAPPGGWTPEALELALRAAEARTDGDEMIRLLGVRARLLDEQDAATGLRTGKEAVP